MAPNAKSQRVRVVIQSRLSSQRLPGKALLTIAGRPVVVLCAQRAANTGMEVVVATSTQDADGLIVGSVEGAGLTCVRGSLDDPLARFVSACRDLDDSDLVIRLTADNLVPDGSLLMELIAARDLAAVEYMRMADRLPHGLGAEVFTAEALRMADAQAVEGYDREHVTPWLRRTFGDGQFLPEGLTPEDAPLRCTIDTLEDFVRASRAIARTDDPVEHPWRELLSTWSHDHGGSGEGPVVPLTQGAWLLGTVQIGVPYGPTSSGEMPDHQEAIDILAAAVDCGVTHLDTAAAYGQSEARIGRFLMERTGGHQVVTKVRPLDGLREDSAPAVAAHAVRSSAEQSLAALGVDRVAALLLHRWEDWAKGGGAAGRELVTLRDTGVADRIGVSVNTPEELIDALGVGDVHYVQLPFNVVDRRWLAEPVQTALASRPDVTVTARSVFLQGLLVLDPFEWPAALRAEGARISAGIQRCVQALGRADAADLCIAFVRGHGFVDSVVLGADRASQVRANAQTTDALPLRPDEILEVLNMIEPGSGALVDPRTWSR